MPKSSLTSKQKDRIYQLSTEDGFSQTKIADLYDVSQSTIHNVIKEKNYEQQISELKTQQTTAMTRGVQAVLEQKGIPDNFPTKCIDA